VQTGLLRHSQQLQRAALQTSEGSCSGCLMTSPESAKQIGTNSTGTALSHLCLLIRLL
jgi:hypothetical protein